MARLTCALASILLTLFSHTVYVVAAPTTTFNYTNKLQQREPFAFAFLNITLPFYTPTMPESNRFGETDNEHEQIYITCSVIGILLFCCILCFVMCCCICTRTKRRECASLRSGPNQRSPNSSNQEATSNENINLDRDTERRTMPTVPKPVAAIVKERTSVGYQHDYNGLTDSVRNGPHVAVAGGTRRYRPPVQESGPSAREYVIPVSDGQSPVSPENSQAPPTYTEANKMK